MRSPDSTAVEPHTKLRQRQEPWPAVGIVDWLCWWCSCHTRPDHSSPARYRQGRCVDRAAPQVTTSTLRPPLGPAPIPRRDDLTEIDGLVLWGTTPLQLCPNITTLSTTFQSGHRLVLPRISYMGASISI